jgi:hypothetical protein
MKKTFKVPKQYAWLKQTSENEFDEVEWFDNLDNYTEEQCLMMCDVISKEFKTVSHTYDHDKFLEIFNYKL